MAALKLLLSQAGRHSFAKRASLSHSPFSFTSHRSLCSSSQSNSNPPATPSQPIPIQPVSYPIKPKSPPPEPSLESSPPPPAEPQSLRPPSDSRRAWTREDIRYVKDAPSIEVVSYAPRVAPLPDDKVVDEGVEIERRKIEAENELRMRMVKANEEERMKVPFPLLIKPKKMRSRLRLNWQKPFAKLSYPYEMSKLLPFGEMKELANAKAKFDETVEAHIRLGVDSKRTELAVRGTVILPHGAPKVCRLILKTFQAVSVAVFAEGAEAEEAKAAGADIVGGRELIEEIASGKNKLKVDKCFSSPGMAPHLGKIAQYLRKRRLMPDKKLGTLTSDIAGQLKELRQGRVEFKMESKSILHVGLGKVSYKEDALRENIIAFMNAVLLAKPAGLKKTSKYAGYVLSVHISSTMGPGLPVSIQSLSKAADNYKKTHVV
ncbi:hypothetical protein ACSQ67_023644 [Phaseolus vulgaris]